MASWLVGVERPITVTWREGSIRSVKQNSLLHKWFAEIARFFRDRNAHTVKGQCHRQFALSIRLRDRQFAWIWAQISPGLNFEQECSLLASGVLNVSSAMTAKELGEYMDAIEQEYRPRGVQLTRPDDE